MRHTLTTPKVWTIALATASVIAIGGTASAADVFAEPTYVPPPVAEAPANPFQGFYLGGHAGYGWANRFGCWEEDFPASEGCDLADLFGGKNDFPFDYDQKGWLAGGQVGYNHVFNGGLVLGAEVSASLTGITGLLEDDPPNEAVAEPFEGVGDWTYLATATGKLGFAINRVMAYGEVGLGLGGFRYNSSACNFESNHQGLVYGGGIEAAISPNNSVFVEYNAFDFHAKDASCGTWLVIIDGGAVYTKPKVQVVKFGFNHFFN